jgi:hypothetical protein
LWLLPEHLEGKSQCRRCSENLQVDRLLHTPKDEVTHFGALHILRLQKEIEYTLLLVCHRHGLWERLVLQKILDYLRVPFITSQMGMHYCELCDQTFMENAVKQGQTVHMERCGTPADWFECPGPALTFSLGSACTIAELRKVSAGKWFFKTNVVVPQSSLNKLDSAVHADERQNSKGMGNLSVVQPFWAPLSTTAEGRRPSTLIEHVGSKVHKDHEEAIVNGRMLLVSRAAIDLAKSTEERLTTSLSRFRAGLGISGRFCAPEDVERASRLERVRDSGIPVKFLREVLPRRFDLWVTKEELLMAEDLYSQKKNAPRG